MYRNALTNNAYSAKNQQILQESAALSGFETLEVAGFKQWLELGRVVAKGQHGTKILMVCEKKDGEPEDGKEQSKRRICKSRTVFFKDQTVELAEKAA